MVTKYSEASGASASSSAKSGSRKFDEVIVQIAEIQALAAKIPADAALDGDARLRQPPLPGGKILFANREGKMERAASAMRRDEAARGYHRSKRPSAPKQQEHAAGGYVKRAKTFVGCHAAKTKEAFVEMSGLLDVFDVQTRFQHARHPRQQPFAHKPAIKSPLRQAALRSVERSAGARRESSSRSTYFARISASRFTASPGTSVCKFVFA